MCNSLAMKISAIIFYLLILGTFIPLHAQETWTGNKILRECKLAPPTEDASELVKWFSCVSYLQGLNDAYNLFAAKGNALGLTPLICPPSEGVPTDQLIRVVRKFLEANPERLHSTGRLLVFGAIRSAWPCPGAQSGIN